MTQQTILLLISALSIGVIHTILGPDHYLPFIVLARARKWSIAKAAMVTTLCGIAHVLSAVILGMIAVSISMSVGELKIVESFRGEVAVWLLIGFGFAYFLWGVRTAIKKKKQEDIYKRMEESSDLQEKKSFKELIPWILFTIFVLGPCEPLIPLVMYPAVQKSILNVFLVAAVFGLGTLFAMLSLVLISVYGAKKLLRATFFERYGNAIAGSVMCGCGLAVKFLGV